MKIAYLKCLTGLAGLLMSLAVQALEITDSRGTHSFAQPPERVIALSWSAAEQLLELGVTPIGVADVKGYRTWVAKPTLPDSVTGVGRRSEPSIERIAALKPDLIITGSQQGQLVNLLESVAPVLHFDNYRADHDNIRVLEQSFMALSKVLGRADAAHARMAERDARLAQLRARLEDAYPEGVPPVAVIRFIDNAHVRVYGDNSTTQAALDALGLKNALPQAKTTWGQVQRPFTDLAKVGDGVLLYIEPMPKKAQLEQAPLWRAMPFVQAGRYAAMDSTWTYGGAISVEHLAQAITDALVSIAP